MSAREPLIGITTAKAVLGPGPQRTFVNTAYVESVIQAGGVPVLLPQQGSFALLRTVLPHLDGLVLSGGQDIDPAEYGERLTHANTDEIDAERDAFELALFAEARERGLPVLGICRGCQLVNVAMRGTLHQDLQRDGATTYGHMPEDRTNRAVRTHDVAITSPLLKGMLGAERFATNSFHHQGIKQLGKGLAAAAYAPDNVIEAVVGTHGAWLVGVQWHPEAFVAEPASPDQRLFQAFVTAARERRAAADRHR